MGGNSMQDRNRHTMSASTIDRHSNHFEGPSNSTRGSDLHGGDARSVLSMDSLRNSRDNNGGARERYSPHYHSSGGNGSGPTGGGGNGNQSSSPPYCPVDGIGGNGGIKSDSPSRKRRRVSSRLPSQSPPAAIWEHRRSPRNGGGMMSLMGSGGGNGGANGGGNGSNGGMGNHVMNGHHNLALQQQQQQQQQQQPQSSQSSQQQQQVPPQLLHRDHPQQHHHHQLHHHHHHSQQQHQQQQQQQSHHHANGGGSHLHPGSGGNLAAAIISQLQTHAHHPQGSPPIRRPRFHREQQQQQQQPPQQQQQQPPQQQRPWESLTQVFQQAPAAQAQHQHPASSLMVDINQVPVSLPLGHHHEQLWTYSAGPHISICSGHPAAPHLPPCQVHGVYPQPFAQTCGIGGHFGSYASSAGPALAVPHPPPHQAHYQHPHLAQQVGQRTDGLSLDGLEHPGASPLHLSPLTTHAHHLHGATPQMTQLTAAAQPIYISTEVSAVGSEVPRTGVTPAGTLIPLIANVPQGRNYEILHRTVRRAITAPRRNFARFHWPGPPPPPPPPPPPAHHQHHHPGHHPTHHHRPHAAPPPAALQAHPQPLGHPQPAHVTLSTTSAYSGILLNFLAMFPLSTYGPPDLNSPDSNETENYEALLSLAERLGEAKPRGLARPEIDQLPSYKFNAETHTGDQTSCVVCMCDFEARQILRVLPCSHEFHAKCVDKWLRSNRTCPICRGNASEYFESSEEQ
uniref:RING-type domain-containing protein n=1 Tax=Anopheles minimus TaxID=112268 RepID=A0A182VR61_9DIPT